MHDAHGRGGPLWYRFGVIIVLRVMQVSGANLTITIIVVVVLAAIVILVVRGKRIGPLKSLCTSKMRQSFESCIPPAMIHITANAARPIAAKGHVRMMSKIPPMMYIGHLTIRHTARSMFVMREGV